ncbi:recQ-mediated genome instability protein 1 [Mugil cephalus]|uniref:recQ-mediated genome instability protein 1 n=1 Tax=Mugil cephalus TaxID=48193 RepID=UPI001FB7C8C5|nr:recQ-mediated genome instability protein 1 [Mugil cephalus]XP_047446893.1 recQ-mediated genome instability protein 1 [Mugil cephalus]
MAPEIQAAVRATQAWLKSSLQVQVPFVWLEACVEWIQGEAGGTARLSQQQINQQVLDQWLLTDLRDLDHPVLPEGLAQAQKTELSGTFCVQVDSLLDVSQPAYGQLQKWKGTDCTNDAVSAVTQATQRPWEAKPTRMLVLQLTDGVQSLEAMEYQSIPALNETLRPGAKLQLQGKMVCRLGMLLLGPSNIKVLGGEVEDLVDRNNQGRVLCRMLGLPEEQQQEQQNAEEAPPAPQQGNQDMEDLELDDAELLASLENEDEVQMLPAEPVQDSGYGTMRETPTQSSRSSSASAVSSRSETSARSFTSGLTHSDRGGLLRGRHDGSEQEDLHREMQDENMAGEDFPTMSLTNFPSMSRPDCSGRAAKPHASNSAVSNASRSTTQKRDYEGCPKASRPAALEPPRDLDPVTDSDFMGEDMDCFFDEGETIGEPSPNTGALNRFSVQSGPGKAKTECASLQSLHGTPPGQSYTSDTPSVPAVTLTSPPFTYLCLLDELLSKPLTHTTEVRVKAFIVTLLGKLSSNSGIWSISATISDGTGYLDAELSDEVLTGLLGFSVAEKGALKRDPARRGELDAGMRRCQEGLVDMCCIMTVAVHPNGRKAVVTKANPVGEKELRELEQRVRDGKK